MKEPDPIQLKAFYEKQKAASYASGHGDCWEMWVELNNRIIERDKRIAALEADKERIQELAWKAAATLRNDRYADRVRHALQHLDEIGDEQNP